MIDEINNVSRSVTNWLKKRQLISNTTIFSYFKLHKFDLNNSFFSHDNDEGGDVFEIKIELIFIFQVMSNSPNLNDNEKMIIKKDIKIHIQ